jgi:hypothetical protein
VRVRVHVHVHVRVCVCVHLFVLACIPLSVPNVCVRMLVRKCVNHRLRTVRSGPVAHTVRPAAQAGYVTLWRAFPKQPCAKWPRSKPIRSALPLR